MYDIGVDEPQMYHHSMNRLHSSYMQTPNSFSAAFLVKAHPQTTLSVKQQLAEFAFQLVPRTSGCQETSRGVLGRRKGSLKAFHS